MRLWIPTAVLIGIICASSLPSSAMAASSPARAEAMEKLAFMHGTWRGTASGTARDGTRYEVVQTERVGTMLDGDLLVIEGRGYRPDGSVGFNAFAVVSWDDRAGAYEFRSYAQGYAGTFEMKLTETGYTWEVPAGPEAIMRYTATVEGSKWHEVGDYVAPGAEPRRMFEMTLERIGDTAWPSADPVPMK
jgi:hypothetical protein